MNQKITTYKGKTYERCTSDKDWYIRIGDGNYGLVDNSVLIQEINTHYKKEDREVKLKRILKQ